MALPILHSRRKAFRWDPHTVCLIHWNGTDGATAATDVARGGNAPHTITFTGGAQLDTAQKMFGTAALLLDGNGDYVTTESTPDFSFGTGPFCLELWMRSTVFSAAATKYAMLFMKHTDDNNYWAAYCWHNSAWAAGVWQFVVSNTTGGTATLYAYSANVSLSDNTWYHVTLNRDGTTWGFAVAGTQYSLTFSTGNTSAGLDTSAGPLEIGCQAGWADSSFPGWLDEMRVSDVARYTADFTPPVDQFAP